MYFVYKLSIEEYFYIGCTNNIRRRKDQHNENARKKKSKLGRYLAIVKKTLSEGDFEILRQSENRAEALELERKITLQMSENGEKLLNDNYTKECSRKGKNLGKTSKNFVVINIAEHSVMRVCDLRQYCIKEGFDYRLLQRTVNGIHLYDQKYKAFHEEDWDKCNIKEKYLDGSIFKEKEQADKENRIQLQSKRYLVKCPNGEIVEIKNADKFAREHGLTSGAFSATLVKNKPTKGYQIIKRL